MDAFCAWLVAHGMSCMEFVGVVLGIITVYLSTRENIWSWPTALVNNTLFAIVFFRNGLYSDSGLQVVYFVLSVYGWYEWLYGGKGHSELHVTRTPRRQWPILAVIGVVAWLGLGAITSRLPGASIPYLDAALVAISLVAQYQMTRKYLENWILWIIANCCYIPMLIYKGLALTAFNYTVYQVLAVMGFISWRRSLRESEQLAAA
jgi:nicotinamide mononucleotide transporter